MTTLADVPEKLGARIRGLREKTNVSQENMAGKIGIDRTYYASIENGRRNVSIKNLHKIALGFGISLSELVEGI